MQLLKLNQSSAIKITYIVITSVCAVFSSEFFSDKLWINAKILLTHYWKSCASYIFAQTKLRQFFRNFYFLLIIWKILCKRYAWAVVIYDQGQPESRLIDFSSVSIPPLCVSLLFNFFVLKLNINLWSKIENSYRELACGNQWLIFEAFIIYSYKL